VEGTTVNLHDFWKVIKRNSGFIAKVTLGVMMLALVISFIIPPTYEAETDVRVKQSKGIGTSLLAELPANLAPNSTQLATYAAIVRSRAVVEEVIKKTQADKEPMPTYENMRRRISIAPMPATEILQIKVRAGSPEEAQFVANTLVGTFKDRLTELVRAEQAEVREFIGERLQESKQELERTETTLERYKREQNLAAPTEQTRAIVDKLAAIDKLSAENKVALAMAQGKLSNAERQLASQQPGFIADSPLIQQLKGKLAELEVQLATLLQNYTEKHPQAAAVRAGIDETKKALNTEITRVVNAEVPSGNPVYQGILVSKIQAEAEIAAAASQQGAIQRIVGEGQRDLNKLPSKEQGLLKVMRDASVAQEIFVMLAKRYEEARIAEVMQPTDLQVIDVAALPIESVSPKKIRNALMGGILGLLASIFFTLYQEFGNRIIRNGQDAKKYLGRPVLASVPDFEANAAQEPVGFWQSMKQLLPGSSRHTQAR
jgi:polysaccharide chain length determinant protein (PEP-CTERM system associated)